MNTLFLPRGIRNNNPGNIRLSAARWHGQKSVQTDTSFVEFETPVAGLRALMRLLLTYYFKYGLNTVESIINRWAPPHENATDHYIHSVSRHLRITRREPIDLTDANTLIRMAEAITRHENGRPAQDMHDFWYAPDIYRTAAQMLDTKTTSTTTQITKEKA